LGQRPKQKTSEDGVVKRKIGYKPLNPPVVRGGLDRRLQTQSKLGEVRGSQLQKSGRESSDELESSAVPGQRLAENVGQAAHVHGGEQVEC